MLKSPLAIDKVRSSRDGHTFHERWAARRALQLVFPKDGLYAISIEGLSSNETVNPGKAAEEIADLILHFGDGDTFETCSSLEVMQFKYRHNADSVTSCYLKKTLQKFADTIIGYGRDFSDEIIDEKLSFSFVTNAKFSDTLWDAIDGHRTETPPNSPGAKQQYTYIGKWCGEHGVSATRLIPLIEFRAGTQDLPTQNRLLRRTITDWSAGADIHARSRLFGLVELVREKAGQEGRHNNLLRREDVLDSLDCDPEDLFPADTRFISVGEVVERPALSRVVQQIQGSVKPVFLYADGGVGKTVFVQSIADHLKELFEVVVFDCFGGGAYRSEGQARHLPRTGIIQIVNELASRGLCDPLLPTDSDRHGLIKVARRRLSQVAQTISEQSEKAGVLIILDAADNAQLEADSRKEEAFPKFLLSALSEEPIEGVKLLLTARTHRKDDVVGDSQVELFELGTFSEEETRTFLRSRRSNISSVELATAIARSRGNARVLDYLVATWDENVLGDAPPTEISVEEIIQQRCRKIFADLHVFGWTNSDVQEFFVAISLLPPPVPLEELANALGWSQSQINSAASDLAPMLEIVSQGAIFRDEPTETYIRETYSQDTTAQQAIADRLIRCQAGSMYAAEALPRLLVGINDIDRAYELAGSADFPTSIQSEYGRRRLRQARVFAAFTLAVKQHDLDKALRLTMQLAEVASANARGDQFIRRASGLAVALGDRDVSRRLFNDRTGWRGARDARLIVAHAFSGELEEAQIHASRTIGWINWYLQSSSEDEPGARAGPEASDFAAVHFFNLVIQNYSYMNHNLSIGGPRFTLIVCGKMLEFLTHYSKTINGALLASLIDFASSTDCKSLGLQVALLATPGILSPRQSKRVARAASVRARATEKIKEAGYDYEQTLEKHVATAAFAALLHNSKQSAKRIRSCIKINRPSTYDYADRYGPSRAWTSILSSCLAAWVRGQKVAYHHLIPHQVPLGRRLKRIDDRAALLEFLKELKTYETHRRGSRGGRKRLTRQFSDQDCQNIAIAIELIISLVQPIENLILMSATPGNDHLRDFLAIWKSNIRLHVHWQLQEPRDVLARAIGLEIVKILLWNADFVGGQEANSILALVNGEKFSIGQKIDILSLFSRRSNLQDVAGIFAKAISAEIGKDEYIEQRGENYVALSSALLPMGMEEAREYYREGLSHLDQMGGDDHDLVYSLLWYAVEQRGGFIQNDSGQRLMNLCQIICHHEPRNFGWTLFGRAAANSIGFSAVSKLLRWHDQDISPYSYGLPQLACFLTKNGRLDPRRAALLLCICADEGWHEWNVGQGLAEIFDKAAADQRETIGRVVVRKLLAEHDPSGWNTIWENLLEVCDKFPGSLLGDWRDKVVEACAISRRLRDENNERCRSEDKERFRLSSDRDVEADAAAGELEFNQIVDNCDPTSPLLIDEALAKIVDHRGLPYDARRCFFDRLREKCLFSQRSDYTFALCEVSGLGFDQTLEQITTNINLWKPSSAYFANKSGDFIEHLFAFKGSRLFDLRYTGVLKAIRDLSGTYGDDIQIMRLVLETITRERLELDGDEWLQVAACLCRASSPEASREALETLVSGPAARAGDDIGEGAHLPEFASFPHERDLIADIFWHLLGHSDGFIRWDVARSINLIAELELYDDLQVLVDRFDSREVGSLRSSGHNLPFQNSQQWFLMGLARATHYHRERLTFLRPWLESLAARPDLHVVHKVHIARCIANLSDHADSDPLVAKLWSRICKPAHGYVELSGWPESVTAKTSFSFDYDFQKYRVSGLA